MMASSACGTEKVPGLTEVWMDQHANAFGTSPYGGVLAIAGDDHACKSSSLPHQSEHMFIGASVQVLSPSNVQEVLDLGIFGWELSRYSGCWVALKAVTENMDSAISANIDPNRIKSSYPTRRWCACKMARQTTRPRGETE